MSDSHSNHLPLPKKKFFQRLRDFFDADPQNREEVIDILRDATSDGVLDRDTLDMLEGVMGVADLRVRDIMVPSAQATMIALDSELPAIVKTVIASGHSRYPVIDKSRDDVVGILLAKDLLPFSALADGKKDEFDLHEHLRKAVVVPESKRCDVLLREFRANRNHMAIVVDEYGSVSGLVTIEDVLEQIVGDIADEYDFDEGDDSIHALSATEWRIRADTEIADFNAATGSDFSDEEFDTIGGVVMQAFGHMPQNGESVQIAPFEFNVLLADSRRLKLLKVKRQ